MQFNSLEFIFIFLPIFLILYHGARRELRNGVMVLGSLAFYAFASGGNYWWLLVLAVVTVLSYPVCCALAKWGRGWLLGICLVFLTGILVFFKLFCGGRFLPAGMSFYLFQVAAHLIDTYRGRIYPNGGFLSFAAQVVMFPKLLSGPLVEPRDLQLQLQDSKPGYSLFHEGLQQFILGLGMKVIIANRLGGLWGQANVIGFQTISTPFAWLALAAWTMRLYFDFYGYSLMAVGIGKMLGFVLPDNFRDPYAAGSVSRFYRCWHITLGAWFREYLYIPLGGNRGGQLRTVLNLALVWLATGLWHGVGGNYLLWAGILFFFIINERLWLNKLLEKTKVVRHLYTVLAILLSWIPFAIGDWQQMITFMGRLVGVAGVGVNSTDYIVHGGAYVWILAAGLILATPLPRKLWNRIRESSFADLALLVLFWVSVYFIATSAQDPFLYFQY